MKVTIWRPAAFLWTISSPIQTKGMTPHLPGCLHQDSGVSHKPRWRVGHCISLRVNWNSIMNDSIQYHTRNNNAEGKKGSLLTVHLRGLKHTFSKHLELNTFELCLHVTQQNNNSPAIPQFSPQILSSSPTALVVSMWAYQKNPSLC